jgi:hypothetical protein
MLVEGALFIGIPDRLERVLTARLGEE